MDLGEALIDRLLAVTTVTDIAGQRVHWASRPQGSALPALVLVTISSVPDETLEGEGDFWVSRVQLEAYARSHAQATALANAASAALLPADLAGAMQFEPGSRTGPRDLSEPDEKGMVYRAVSDVILRHSANT